MDKIKKYSLIGNAILVIWVILLIATPRDIKTVEQTKVRILQDKVTKVVGTKVEYRDKIVDRVITKYEAGTTIVIHETSTDKGKVDSTTDKKEEVKTDTKTDTKITTTETAPRNFTAGAYWNFTRQAAGVLIGLNLWNLTPVLMTDYSPLYEQLTYSAGLQIRF
jgi:hypothetical protein